MLCLFLTHWAKGQQLTITGDFPVSKKEAHRLRLLVQKNDSLALTDGLNRLLRAAWAEGFIEASWRFHQTEWTFNSGHRRLGVRLQTDSALHPLCPHIPSTALVTSWGATWGKTASDWLDACENSGFPFASIRFSSLAFAGDTLTGKVKYESGPYIVFDSLTFLEEAPVRKDWLMRYLGIMPGEPYAESVVRAIPNKLAQLGFIETIAPVKWYFDEQIARGIFHLSNRQNGGLNGVIGMAPNSSTASVNGNGRFLVTGELHALFPNAFRTGKSIQLDYRSFLARSQDLTIKAEMPWLWGSSAGLNAHFALLKFDTLYLNLSTRLGATLDLNGFGLLRAFTDRQSTNLLTLDTFTILQIQRLPAFHDVKQTQYGFNFQRRSGYLPSMSSRGWRIEAEASVGRRRVPQNTWLAKQAFLSSNGRVYGLYDSIKAISVSWKQWVNAECWLPLGRSFVGYGRLSAGWVASPNLFQNDLFRIGGLRTLKGFDEQSIFANRYAIFEMQGQYKLSDQGRFILLSNSGLVSNSLKDYKWRMPWAIGTGFQWLTGNNVFQLYYALGTWAGQSLNFQAGKIHVGFVNRF